MKPAHEVRVGVVLARCAGVAVAGVSLAVFTAAAWAGSLPSGYAELEARLGSGNVPTGSGTVVGQVEAAESPGNYGPAQSNSEFAGKSFTAQSGPPGSSGHATLVGQVFYGLDSSFSPGVTSIFLYEAGSWATTAYLRTGQGAASPPLPTPGGIKIFNNSWIGSFGTAAGDNECVRRADLVVTRDNLLICNGVNNGQPQNPLMCFMFNGISVGLSNGTHASGPTPAGYDGPGRQKPEIVGPGQFTSFVTPQVSSAGALLRGTAQTFAGLAGNANALRSEVLKSVILGGASHFPGWSNNPATSGANRGVTTTSLDPVYGTGALDVDVSHRILTGLEQDGADAAPAAPNAHNVGWDLASVPQNASKHYRFHLPITADSIQVTAAWHRIVANNLGSYTTADFTLSLKRIDAAGQVQSLVGDAGLPYFTGGDVVSQSSVNNVEHLYVTGLAPGDYVIQVQRVDALAGNRDVAVSWLIPKKAGDVNGDGFTDIDDLFSVINAWGACPGCPADLNGGGEVDIDDLFAVINGWG